ncbi:MAG TPA: hydantoinase/oxoprolinase family protein, partial [Gemmatimonadaceae bacterium]|nr:hydantoinase/oxoprolinase family protein [Gemmatimonadaceae bacterium]
LLHAHRRPEHERMLADALRAAAPRGEVVCSSDVFPEVREYERTATTVAEAYLRPVLAGYLGRLSARVTALGMPVPGVMTSSGALRSASGACTTAAALALSGPAGGVAGAAAVLRAAAFADALTIDIGGTSADVGLIVGGEPLVEPGGAVAGVPIALPRVLVETVSAGGGSIVWVDDGGALRVGPRSAGASPGPAAFGRGGEEATLTDAHVVLRHVAAERLSGGIVVDAALAKNALGQVAAALGLPLDEVARAAVETADATMARALRRVSVQRGIDPWRGVLVAFGGGGPLHACGLAEQLGMRRVLVPPFAGVLSALGLAIAPERRESMASLVGRLDDAGAIVGAVLRDLERRAGEVAGGRARWWLRARYEGQGHELDLPVEPDDAPGAIAERFGVLHWERFGFRLERPVELVSARCAVTGEPWPVRFAGDEGERVVRGAATLTLADATLLVREGWTARALPIGGWLLERDR